jgi:hypothetical protein
MTNKNGLSITEKLLISAFDLEETGKSPFSAEDLVVAAWQKFPDAFGLAGYRDNSGCLSYPNSNRVFAEIMGSKPIRKRGFLKKVGTKMYQLTEGGREHALLLLGQKNKPSTEKAGLSREIEQQLRRLFDTRATDKVARGHPEEITFYDACAFWGISPRSSAIELEGKIANLREVLQSAQKVAKGGTICLEHGGRTYGPEDLEVLLHTHEHLLSQFTPELEVIRTRIDERKV